MSILTILNELATTNSRNDKLAVLAQHMNNAELKLAMYVAYNPKITLWISKHPPTHQHTGEMTLTDAITSYLDRIATRAITGNAAIEHYQNLLIALNDDDAEVMRRIVDRNLKCGVNASTINKIWPDLIPVYGLMKAYTDPKKLVFPCYTQTKMDGVRTLISSNDGIITIQTGQAGKSIPGMDNFKKRLDKIMKEGETLDGELIVLNKNGDPLPRKTSNGIINKAIRGTISEEEESRVRFYIWDIIDESSTIHYATRFDLILDRFMDDDLVIPVETKIAHNFSEVELHFADAVERGEEGIIAKNVCSFWTPKRSYDMVKFKSENTADLVVVDWIEGLGRLEGKMGSLVCEDASGKLKVNIGTGFSDAQRDQFTRENIVGKIVEVTYNEVIQSEDLSYSLYLARFTHLRDDKIEANTLSELNIY